MRRRAVLEGNALQQQPDLSAPQIRCQDCSASSMSLKASPRNVIRETRLRARRAVAPGGEGRFDRVRRAQMRPVLGEEVTERKQRVTILAELLGGLRIFRTVMAHEAVGGGVGLLRVGALQISCRPLLARPWLDFGSALRTLPILWNQHF